MKLFIKLLLFLLVLACALPFITLGPGGQPLMRVENLKWPELGAPRLPEAVSADAIKKRLGLASDEAPATDDLTTSTVYKWRNGKGELQYTSDRPPDGIAYETLALRSDTNVVAAVQAPPPPAEEAPGDKNAAEGGLIEDLTSVYSPGKVKELIDQAKQVQKLSRERKKMLDGLMDTP